MRYRRRRGSVAVTTLAVLLCGLIVGACGGSSKSSSTGSGVASTSTASGSHTSPSGTTPSKTEVAAAEALLAKYRACLKKYGVNLPASKVGEPIKQPRGVTPARYAAARAKCRGVIAGGLAAPSGSGAGATGAGTAGGTGSIPNGASKASKGSGSLPKGSATVPNPTGGTSKGGQRKSRPVSASGLARLRKFAACMRENGVKLPLPTARQPLFVPKGVDSNSPQFKAAEEKCLPRLSSR
ncbi:MAG: hypothetical protein E6G62_09655 [Actinobacteria bacterium]|nr:MAG: hypothetical protein E6G62_09655 [Actinomycetota bacterium]